MVYDFSELVYFIEDFRVMDVLLPFLLIFTIVFAILQKTKIMGKERKNYNVVIALVVALSVVIPHVTGSYPAGIDVVEPKILPERMIPNQDVELTLRIDTSITRTLTVEVEGGFLHVLAR